jgi:dihydrofolate reductase
VVITLIAAVDRRRAIGLEGRLPWHLPRDLRRFMQRTLGKTLVMGRKTFETLKAPLPGRRTIVLTRDRSYAPEGVEVAHDVEEALRLAGPVEELMVAGGGEIYALFLPLAHRLDLTLVDADLGGDAFFPEWDHGRFRLVSREDHAADARHAHPHSFLVYERQAG